MNSNAVTNNAPSSEPPSRKPSARELHDPRIPSPAIALPNGWRVESLEQFADTPARVKQTITTHRTQDFIDYVNRYREHHSLVVFSSELRLGQPMAKCLLDYHTHTAETDDIEAYVRPSWSSHRVQFAPQASLAYKLLLALDGKLFPQGEFAVQIRDVARFCEQPQSADLLEVVRTLNLTAKGEFASFDDDLSGSVQMRYDLQVNANAGTQQRKLDVPRELVFRVPLLQDGESLAVRAELMYRIPRAKGEAVALGIRLPDRLWLERDLIEAQATLIREATQLLTIVGEVA